MLNLNPLDILGQREVSTLPPHFAKMQLEGWDFLMDENNIKQWIFHRLRGRFCIIKMPGYDSNDKLRSCTVVGFEDHKELTFFMLGCTYIRRNQ